MGASAMPVARLREALEQQRVAAGKARIALNLMGVGGNLNAAQDRLRSSIDQTNAALDKQRQRSLYHALLFHDFFHLYALMTSRFHIDLKRC